jgi:hypothetical protein
MSTDKIGAQHRARKAVLYIRQSSAHQAQYNRESQVLPYAMRDRLVEPGWSDIEVIDEDLGRSAAGGTTRLRTYGRRSLTRHVALPQGKRYRAKSMPQLKCHPVGADVATMPSSPGVS